MEKSVKYMEAILHIIFIMRTYFTPRKPRFELLTLALTSANISLYFKNIIIYYIGSAMLYAFVFIFIDVKKCFNLLVRAKRIFLQP